MTTTRAGKIHPSADVSPLARIGEGTSVWNLSQVRERAQIGRSCILGTGVYVDVDVTIGDRCKLQNGVLVYHGFTIEDGVFLGPGVMLLNDMHPRAVNPDGTVKTDSDWVVSEGRVCEGASVGGGSIVLPGVTLGRWCMVGAGSVVTRDIPDHALVYGDPARLAGFVCFCGQKLAVSAATKARHIRCKSCGREVVLNPAAGLSTQ